MKTSNKVLILYIHLAFLVLIQFSLGYSDGTAHPSYVVSKVPLNTTFRTMGMAFLSDGRMVVAATFQGTGEITPPDTGSAIYLISGISTPNPTVVKIADMFREPSGVVVVNDKIFVPDRDAFYSIPSNEPTANPSTNKTKIVDWPFGANWHQFVFTPFYKDGFFYAPYSGAFLKWDMEGKKFEKVAGGLRSPNGLGMNDDGDMFVTDNQGSYLPGCTLMHMKPGKFYGHHQSNPTPNFAEAWPYQPPAVWIPYGSSGSFSTTQPFYLKSGQFKGQWIAGDANGQGMMRFALEKVKGEYQGAAFRFTKATDDVAINRIIAGPDGAMYLGTIDNYGNWPSGDAKPMYILTAKATPTAFEMQSISLLKDGLEITFTEPVDKSTLMDNAITLWQSHRNRDGQYGCCVDHSGSLNVLKLEASEDGKRVYVKADNIQAMDYVINVTLKSIKSAAGKTPWDDWCEYTVNYLSDKIWDAHAVTGSVDIKANQSKNQKFKYSMSAKGILKISIYDPSRFNIVESDLRGKIILDK